MKDLEPLQGLRGVLAMAIFLGHQIDLFLLSPWKKPDQVVIGLEYLQAVSLFFYLSGIPLAKLYGHISSGSDSSSGSGGRLSSLSSWSGRLAFWRKRVARLAPTYYLALSLNLAVLLLLFNDPNSTAGISVDILKTNLASFFGCAFLLQGWFVSLINVGGVLWQIAIFAYGYLVFPFLTQWISNRSNQALIIGIMILWLLSMFQWTSAFVSKDSTTSINDILWASYVWHVKMISRFPQLLVGILLGELLQRQQNLDIERPLISTLTWAIITDAISIILLLTAIQAPIVQWYYGTEVRSIISIGLEAIFLPIHILWLAGIVLSYDDNDNGIGTDSRTETTVCWTRRALSFKPLISLGNISLVLYCFHIDVLFLYNGVYAYLKYGHWKIIQSDYSVSVFVPWWQALIQWALVISVSYLISEWFESPLRHILSKQKTIEEKKKGEGDNYNSLFVLEDNIDNEKVSMLSKTNVPSSYGGASSELGTLVV